MLRFVAVFVFLRCFIVFKAVREESGNYEWVAYLQYINHPPTSVQNHCLKIVWNHYLPQRIAFDLFRRALYEHLKCLFTDREALLTSLKDRMVESVQINFDFTHKISYIASPLTVWRLNACTAVWAGNNELVNAHKVTPFMLDEAEADRRRGGEDEEEELARKRGASGAADAAAAAAAEEEAEAARREAEAAEQARLEAEMYAEGQLDPEEIASAERPPLKEWIKYV